MGSRSSRLMLLVKHYLASPWRSLVVAVVVVVAAFVIVAAPRAGGAAATAELRTAVAALDASGRDLVADAAGGVVVGPGAGDRLPPELAEIYGATEEALAGIRADAGPALAPLLGDPGYVARTAPFPVRPPDGSERDFPLLELRFAADPFADERLRLVEGAWPAVFDWATASPDAGIDVVLSAATAEAMRWPVGQTRRLPGFPSVRLSGTFDAADPDDRSWRHVDSVLVPEIDDDGNRPPTVTGIGYVNPATLGATPLTGRWRIVVWYPLGEPELDVEEATGLAAELRRFTAATHELPIGSDSTGARNLRFDTATLGVLDTVLGRSATSGAVLALTASGPLGVVLAVLALTASAVAAARRPVLLLAASRGASSRALRGAVALEGALAGIPAALIGGGAALLLVPGPVAPPSFVAAALLGLAPAVVFAVRAAPPLRQPGRADLSSRSYGPARMAVDVLAVGAAVLATTFLLIRGPLTDAGVLDPVAVSAPLALAVAGAVGLRRVLPAPLLAVQRRARRGRGIALFAGIARAIREPLPAVAALALVVAVAVALFSSIMLSTIGTGTAAAVRAQLGADVRVEGPVANADQRAAIAGIPGVAAVAGVERAGTVSVLSGGSRVTVDLVLVDGAALSAIDPAIPAALADVVADGPIPLVLSPALAAELDPDDVEFTAAPAVVVAVAEGGLGLGDGSWIAVDGAASPLLGAGAFTPRTLLIDLTPGGSGVEIGDAAVALLGPSARATTVEAAQLEAAGAPTLAALRTGFAIAVALAAAFVGLAVVLSAVLAAGRRRELVDSLAALGATRRQLLATIVAEAAPPTIAATLVGAVLGFVMPFLVLAGTDLTPLVGGDRSPAIVIDPFGVVGILTLAVVVTSVSLLPALLPVLRRPNRRKS